MSNCCTGFQSLSESLRDFRWVSNPLELSIQRRLHLLYFQDESYRVGYILERQGYREYRLLTAR